MLLKMVRGCMADSLTVDGKEEMDLTDGERKEVLKRIFTVWSQKTSMR